MRIQIIGRAGCSWCQKAEEFLHEAGFDYAYINFYDLEEDWQKDVKEGMIDITGKATLPAIYINEELIGGYAQLIERAKT